MSTCTCKHWEACGVANGGCCSLNLYGGKPSLGVCERCPSYDGPARGLGDRIASLTKATGIAKVVDAIASATGKDCGCNQRRVTLNQMFPSSNAK